LTNKFLKITKIQYLKTKLFTCVVLIAVAILFAAASITILMQRPLHAQQSDPDVQLVSNVEMIKGHMAQAVANKEKNDLVLAKAHAGHPLAEHYSIVQSQVEQHDAQLDSQLKAALDTLAGNVDTMAIANFKAETDRIGKLLDEAVSKVIPASEARDIKFNAKVIIAILTQAEKEYEEAVHDGEIAAMVEYQDAQAFRVQANNIFDLVADELSAHEVEIAADFFNNLESSMNSIEDVSKIAAEIDGITNEVREGAGLPAESDPSGDQVTAIQYIENIRELLKQLSVEYKNGNFTGAEQLAITAYLDNFEYVEVELVRHNATDLKEETEQMLRVELRDMIKNRASSEQIDNHIVSINAKLDQAVIVVPEFSLGMTALIITSLMALTILASRVRKARSHGNGTI
jgi:hypothetical protein